MNTAEQEIARLLLANATETKAIRQLLSQSSDWVHNHELVTLAFQELTELRILFPPDTDNEWITSPTTGRGRGNGIAGLAIVHRSATIHSGTALLGDVVIGRDVELGPNTTVFGPTVIGGGSYLGPGVEVRRSMLLADVTMAHRGYVGHSIVGRRANLAANFTTAVRNLKRGTVHRKIDGQLVDTGQTYFGALIGDDVATGCDVLVMPGRMVEPGTIIPYRTVIV